MADDADHESKSPPASGILPRPLNHLNDLPVAFRWEVTRRHPYYLQFWELAHKYHCGQLTDPIEQNYGKVAAVILECIGVSGDPPAPNSEPTALGMNQLATAWKGGAVAPITFCSMAGMMIQDLPKETRRLIAQTLLDSTADSGDEPAMRHALIQTLVRDPTLNCFPNRPIIGINIKAPQRAIQEAVEQIVQQWKVEQDIPQRRRRDDMIPQYLSIWDLREGWATDHYKISREMSFQEIADSLGLPLRTVANGYCSAFRLVAGHEYRFEYWARIFMVVKLADVNGCRSLRRRQVFSPPRQAQAAVPVPESVLTPGTSGNQGSGFISNAVSVPSGNADVDLVIDIRSLLARKWSDAKIIKELELDPDAAHQLIGYLRERNQDTTD